MLTQEIKSKVQRLWNMFWSRGITNPIIAIEQISYLLFIRRLEKIDEYDDVMGYSKKTFLKVMKNVCGVSFVLYLQMKCYIVIKTKCFRS